MNNNFKIITTSLKQTKKDQHKKYFIEIEMAKNNNQLKTLIELLEAFFDSARSVNKKRTWHQHVVPYEDGWVVRHEGNKRITSKHRKQSTAINKAKMLAKCKKADVIIHRESGGIRDRISYKEH